MRAHHRMFSTMLVAAVLSLAATAVLSVGATAAIKAGNATIHTVDVEIAPDELGAGTVTCPARKRAISGGTAMRRDGEGLSPDFAAKLVASGPLKNGRAWHGAAFSFEDEPILLQITVACLPKGKVGKYMVKTKDLVPDGSLHVEGSLGCGKGKRMATVACSGIRARAGRLPRAPTTSSARRRRSTAGSHAPETQRISRALRRR